MILAGDIGGTKSHLALYRPGDPPRSPVVEARLPSREYDSAADLIQSFLRETGERPRSAVLGIAGPVVGNRSDTTNLPWRLDGASLGDALEGAEVRLLNDLEATAWGVPLLADGDLEVLYPGDPTAGNRALVAAGTGLGEALLRWNGRDWTPSPSEGGHTDFGPRDPLEDQLLVWLRGRYGRVSYERILSGPGLADLHRFLRDTGRGDEPRVAAARFDDAPDPAVVVTETALDGSCERARLAVERFCEVYGAEAGNAALKFLAIGGVFLGGGIAPRILPILRAGGFLRAFLDKGRLRPLVERIPVRVILDPAAALWGAAAVALRR